MKNMKSNIVKVIGLSLMAIILFAILACKQPVDTPPEDLRTKKNWTLEFDFGFAELALAPATVYVIDSRTLGNENLLNFDTTILENALNDAYDNASGPAKGRFRNVFGLTNEDGVTIHIVGPETAFKLQVETRDTLRFNVDYLSSGTVQQSITDAVNYINSNIFDETAFPHTIAP